MGVIALQSDFSHGEMDRKVLPRVDLEIYYKCARKLRNMYVLPQGGVTKRHGTLFIDEIIANSGEYKLFEFELDAITSYLLVFIDGIIKIYKIIDDTTVNFIVDIISVWDNTQVVDLRISQKSNLMVITHPDVVTQQLTNLGADNLWSLIPFTFSLLPPFDFNEVDYSNFSFSLSKVVPGIATLTSSDPVFTAEMVGGSFTSLGASTLSPLGVARITAFVSTTEVTVDIIFEFDDVLKAPSTVKGSEAFLGEPAFSATRGWPQTVTFYEGRLWFGGTTLLPSVLFASTINNFNRFDTGRGFDDDAIVVEISTKRFNAIKHLESDKSLQIFTTDAEFTIPQLEETALTPANISIRKQSNNGTANVEPVLLDNQTFFIQKGGRNVMRFIYSNNTASYQSEKASLIAAQLIKNPIDSASLRSPSKTDAEYMFLINEDGTMATYQSILEENISAWTLSATGQDINVEILDQDTFTPVDGKFKSITSVKDTLFVIVERQIDGQTKQYLERLTFDVFTDATILKSFGVPTTIITGLETLEGITVAIRADGFVLTPQTVTNGEIEVSRASQEFEIGILFNPLLVPIPANIPAERGQLLYEPKRLSKVFVEFFESGPFYFDKTRNTNRIAFDRQFGLDTLDSPSTPKTGVSEEINIDITGWTARPEIIITQFDPLPLTILAVAYEVNT